MLRKVPIGVHDLPQRWRKIDAGGGGTFLTLSASLFASHGVRRSFNWSPNIYTVVRHARYLASASSSDGSARIQMPRVVRDAAINFILIKRQYRANERPRTGAREVFPIIRAAIALASSTSRSPFAFRASPAHFSGGGGFRVTGRLTDIARIKKKKKKTIYNYNNNKNNKNSKKNYKK